MMETSLNIYDIRLNLIYIPDIKSSLGAHVRRCILSRYDSFVKVQTKAMYVDGKCVIEDFCNY